MPTLAMEAMEALNNSLSLGMTNKTTVEYFMEILDKKIHEAKDMLLERFK